MPELTETSEDVRVYEFCVLYPANLAQKEESTLLKEVENIIVEQGGKQVAKDSWGKRGLAYSIKGHDEGIYVVYHYEIDPSKIQEIDENLRITPNLLRHMVVKPPKGYEIVKFSDAYAKWLKERETEEDRKKKEKEAKLAKKVADKAKRQAQRTAKAAKEDEQTEKPETDKKKISEELDKLISDDDLDI